MLWKTLTNPTWISSLKTNPAAHKKPCSKPSKPCAMPPNRSLTQAVATSAKTIKTLPCWRICWLPFSAFSHKDKAGKDFVCDQAKEALNFQITVILAVFVSCLLMIVLIGILLFWLVLAANFVLCIIAAIAASKGTAYRYPFALRLIK